MSFTKRLGYALVFCLLSTAPAAAQDSTQARIYANVVSNALDRRGTPPSRVEAEGGKGIALQYDGLRITRLQFPTAAEALAYAANSDLGIKVNGNPTVIEARGRQVVVLSGAKVRSDLPFTRRALDAAWRYLPNRDTTTDLLGVVNGDETMAAWSPITEGPLHDAIANAVSSAREKPEMVTRAGAAFVYAGGGVVSAFRQGGERGGVYGVAPNSEALSEIVTRLETVAGRSMGLDAALLQASMPQGKIKTSITDRMDSSPRRPLSDARSDRRRAATGEATGALPADLVAARTLRSDSDATTITYRSGGGASMPMELDPAQTSGERLDLSGIWSVQLEDGDRGEVPGTVKFERTRSGTSPAQGQDEYLATVVFKQGDQTRTVELDATFDGETLVTTLREQEDAQDYAPRIGAADVIATLGQELSQARPEQREGAPAEERPEGRYEVELSVKDATFTAKTEVQPEGPTPIKAFKRYNQPDVTCPAEFASVEEVLWAAPNLGNSISNGARTVYGQSFSATTSVTHRILVSGRNDRDTLDFYLADKVADLSNVIYVIYEPWGGSDGTVWMRDFGPITVVRNRDRQPISGDMGYFPGRGTDDLVPKAYSQMRGWGHRDVNRLKLEGGNFMADGQGRVFTTTRATEGSGRYANDEQEQVEDYLFELGGREVLWFERMPSPEGTGHIDMFAKLINERSVLIGSTTGSSGGILDRNAAKFEELGYQVVRLPMGDSPSLRGTDGETLQTYTNSLFVNGVALVPQYGDAAADARAVEVYRGLGFNAVGIDAKALITANGAVHCISMQIPRVGQ